MVKYLCKDCSYRFKTRTGNMPKTCPACGSNGNLVKDYDAESLLKEVMEGDPL